MVRRIGSTSYRGRDVCFGVYIDSLSILRRQLFWKVSRSFLVFGCHYPGTKVVFGANTQWFDILVLLLTGEAMSASALLHTEEATALMTG